MALGVGKGVSSGTTRSYVKLTLPVLNTGDIIFSANYYSSLYTSNSSTRQINVHKVLGDWSSSTITWNNAPGYNSKVEDYAQVTGAAGDQFSWDITSIAKDWYSTGNNYGLMLKNNDETVGYNEFFSSDTSDAYAGYRPTAVLDFVNNTGLESQWTYHSQDASRAGTGYVNDYNGNLVFVHDDISMSGSRMPVAINHVFNSNDKGSNINFGKGWRLNLSQTVTSTTFYINGSNVLYYKYIDEDGTVHYFQDGTSPIKEELGADLNLTKNGDGSFTIKDKKDNKLNFNSSGTLVNITDSNNNTLTLNYTNSKLTNVTDGVGRVTALNYNASGYLSEIVAPDTVTKTTYNYTGDQLTSIGYIDGKTSIYTYDGNVNLTSAVSYSGYKITYGYYGAAPYRVSSISESNTDGTQGDQLNVSYGFNTTTFTDTKNKKNVYQFDNIGKTICIKDQEGNAKYYKYGDSVNSTKITTESKLQKTVNNILPNPSGEADRNWTLAADGGTGSGGFTTEDKHYGNRSLKIAKTDNVSREYLQQVINLEKGKTYTLSAYVKTVGVSNTSGKGGSLAVHYKTSSGAYEGKFSNFINGTNDWQRIQQTFTIPADGTDTSTIIRPQLEGETGTVYFDDIQLEEGSIANRYNLVENGDFSGTGTVPSGW